MDYELKPGFTVCYRKRARWIPAWLARLMWHLRPYEVDVVNVGYTVSKHPGQAFSVNYEMEFDRWQ